MNVEEAKEVFINRGFIPDINGKKYFDGDAWRLACHVLRQMFIDEKKEADNTTLAH